MRTLTRAAVVAIVVAAAVVYGVPQQSSAQTRGATRPAPRAKLVTLDNLTDLKAAFNTDHGKIRIILLLSPT
jgi:hypothetical protein